MTEGTQKPFASVAASSAFFITFLIVTIDYEL